MVENICVATLQQKDKWDEIQKAGGIPSHGWANAKALSYSGITPELIRVSKGEGQLILPVFRRFWRGREDICTLTSVSGAFLENPTSVLHRVWLGHCLQQGWVAGYLQFDPQSPAGAFGNIKAGNSVFILDLSPTNPLQSASQIIRRKIQKATAERVSPVYDRNQLAEALMRLYPLTMHRARALSVYNFSARSLKSWATAEDHVVIGAAIDTQILAVSLFLTSGTKAEYHLAASHPEARHLSAWLLAQSIKHLKSLGISSLNLGGGVSPGDGLYEFKKKFGGTEARLSILREIYDVQVYNLLCSNAHVASDETWFPAYRADSDRRYVCG